MSQMFMAYILIEWNAETNDFIDLLIFWLHSLHICQIQTFIQNNK